MNKLSSCKTVFFVCVVCVIEAIGSYARTFTNLVSFNGANGIGPAAGLVQATDGNLYGTTVSGGKYNSGTVFQITPGGELTTVYNFCVLANCADGNGPFGALIQATDGNFYGTTLQGGEYGGGAGTVFKITPSGKLTILHSFCSLLNCLDGDSPTGALIQATDGRLYGTTRFGGKYGEGTIFKITSTGQRTTLYDFCPQDQLPGWLCC